MTHFAGKASTSTSSAASSSSLLSPDLLHAYQNRAVDRLYGHNSTLAIMPMGAGKTVTTATAVAELLGDGEVRRVLVIAPLRVAQMVWEQEFKAWAHTAHVKVAVAIGSAEKRAAALRSDAQVVVINYENIQWLCDNFAADFDAIVFDEISKFKKANGKRIKALRQWARNIRIRIGLTGTPTANNLMDIYGPADMLRPGILGKSFYKFRETYFRALDPNGWKWAPKPDAEQAIYDALAPLAFRMEDRDYVELPGLVVNDVRVALPVQAMRHYREMEDAFATSLGDARISAANGGVVVGKLRQITAGFMYSPSGDGTFAPLHTAKFDAVEELVEELQGQPAIVVYEYQAELKMYLERFEKAYPGQVAYIGAGLSNAAAEGAVARWNARELRVLLVHPASAGHGLNLQRGGNNMIFASLTWSREMYDQVIARLYRQGQKERVFVHRVMVPDTVDMTIAYALDHKKSITDALLEGLSERGASL
jgi:SNF2 family DNA or RNA helicase